MKFEGTERYYLSPELGEIVNISISMEKPLLLMGEAGTGKTRLAFEIGRAFGINMEEARCKSTFKGEELCYVYDTVLRLNDSRFGSGESGRNVNDIWDYLRFGPIGRAFLAEDRRVLLLDEIDKTDSDTQDNLLDVLEDGSFTIREINHKVAAQHMPIIIITSNAKGSFPIPFCGAVSATTSPSRARKRSRLSCGCISPTSLNNSSKPVLRNFTACGNRGSKSRLPQRNCSTG